MKGAISKIPVTIPHRSGTRTGIVFVTITKDEKNFLSNKRRLIVVDYEVIPNPNPQPGERLVNYVRLEENKRDRTSEEINAAWAYINRDIVASQPLEDQLDDLYADFVLLDTQSDPIRDSQPQDWELHIENMEVVPGEPEPDPLNEPQ